MIAWALSLTLASALPAPAETSQPADAVLQKVREASPLGGARLLQDAPFVNPRRTQFITFGSPPPSVLVGGTGRVWAVASSNLAVLFSSLTTDVCMVSASVGSGGTVRGIAAGACTIAADQFGSHEYWPAAQKTQTFAVLVATAVYLNFNGPSQQTAIAGAAVPAVPSVIVTAVLGLDYDYPVPYPGVSVAFAVASGGGSATGSSATTNASGIATLGSWTLGSIAGTNTLTAVGAGESVTFTATGIAAPSVTTPAVTGVTATTAILGGHVTADGGSAITERGIVYSLTATNAHPLVGGNGVTRSTVSGSTGLFSSAVTGLAPASGYSFRAYAANAVGTSHTPIATFATAAAAPDAPTMGTATAGDTTVSVTFTAPMSNGGSAITGYTATCGTKSETAASSPITVTGLTNGATVTCTVVALNAVGASVPSGASNSVTPGPPGASTPRLVNISTRATVQTGDNVTIAGFTIDGAAPKNVLITARGPSLAVAPFNVPGTLADPFMQLFSAATQINFNDDFGSRANAGEIPDPIKPTNAKEAAILTTLSPGPYTVVVTGVDGTSGVAIVEVFEVGLSETPLVNLSMRSRVEPEDNAMIAGFIIQGTGSKTVLVTARGPSLAAAPYNVPGTLTDPYLRIYSGQTIIYENDNWADWPTASQMPEAQKPRHAKDAAALVTLSPGAYTIIVGGGVASSGSGIAIVEVFVQ